MGDCDSMPWRGSPARQRADDLPMASRVAMLTCARPSFLRPANGAHERNKPNAIPRSDGAAGAASLPWRTVTVAGLWLFWEPVMRPSRRKRRFASWKWAARPHSGWSRFMASRPVRSTRRCGRGTSFTGSRRRGCPCWLRAWAEFSATSTPRAPIEEGQDGTSSTAWDGIESGTDRVYTATTPDFIDFDDRHTIVHNGMFVHVSNINVQKLDGRDPARHRHVLARPETTQQADPLREPRRGQDLDGRPRPIARKRKTS